MTTGVGESKSGAKSKKEEQDKAAKVAETASAEEGKAPEEASKVSPEDQEPLVYSQRQADALLHAERSELGRKVKDIETERDNLKSQMATKETELDGIQAERESLEKQIDDLTSDDPKKFDLTKRDRDLRTRERELKTKISNLDSRETNLGEREKKVNSFEREVLIESIADEYEDGDVAKLKNAISGFESPTEEQIRTIAEIFWQKKGGEGEKKPKAPKPYSGKTEGGSSYFTTEQIADREFWKENKEEILKAQAEGRIRD